MIIFKKAFTLAEILIVLVIIGILTMILLPIAFQSSPDEDVMKFKKGYNTLGSVIRELVTSDKYYQNGDLGIKASGEIVDSPTYLCETFADIVSTKSVECSKTRDNVKDYVAGCQYNGMECIPNKDAEEKLDDFCKEMISAGEEIVTTDGIVYYQANPGLHFGAVQDGVNFNVSIGKANEDGIYDQFLNQRVFTNKDPNGFYRIYKIFCMDIDGINKKEDPFGFGIRLDGKILPGARALEWTNKSIHQE